MSIFEHRPDDDRARIFTRAIEALALALPLAMIPEMLAIRAGTTLELHPGWIAVLVLAARYGLSGFLSGTAAVAGMLGAGSVLAGAGVAAWWSRLDSAPNLIALGASLATAGVASWHLRRQSDLLEQLRKLSDRCRAAEVSVATLRDVTTALRARVDRTWTSMSFIRDVTARLEGGDPVSAAEAAADLAQARSGASAAVVKVGAAGFHRLLAVRDARGPNAVGSLALTGADLSIPLRHGTEVLGVLALWGVPRKPPDDATVLDLAIIGSWCGGALHRAGMPARTATLPAVTASPLTAMRTR